MKRDACMVWLTLLTKRSNLSRLFVYHFQRDDVTFRFADVNSSSDASAILGIEVFKLPAFCLQ